MASYLHHAYIKAALFRASLLTLVWWSLANGTMSSWLIGIPAIIIAVFTSLKLLPAANFSIRGLIGFIPFFIQHSITGGIDVATRAMRPDMRFHPELVEFKPRIEQGTAIFVMLTVINLLPGTLCTELQSGTLKIHVLNTNLDYLGELQAIETKVARLFSINL